MFSWYLSSTQTEQHTLSQLLLAHRQVTYAFIQHIVPVIKLNPDSTTSGIPFELYNSEAT